VKKSKKAVVKKIDLHAQDPLEIVKLAESVSAALRKLGRPSSKAKLSKRQHIEITRAVYAASDACKDINNGQ
jgi:hypothetical protein